MSNVQISSSPIEIVGGDISPPTKVEQTVVETIGSDASPPVELTQMFVEIIVENIPVIFTAQMVAETIAATQPPVHVAQTFIEVIKSNKTNPFQVYVQIDS